MNRRPLARFAAELELTVSSDAPATASPSSRTVEGIIVPFGPAGRTSGGMLTFGAGSLRWSEPKRVKLLVEHDQRAAVGYAEALEERPEGLWARFKVPEGPAGDQVLAEAANGVRDAFSVGVMLDAAVEQNLRRAQGRQAVKGTGQLRETSMVSVPAFDDARVGSVAANATRLVVSGWTDTTDESGDSMFTEAQRRRLAELLAQASLTDEERTERDELQQLATAAGVTVTAASSSSSSSSERQTTDSSAGASSDPAEVNRASSERPATVPATHGMARITSEPSTYSLDGTGPSLVRDAFRARMDGDHDAADRLRRFNAELAQANPASVSALTTAAVEDSSTGGDLVPTLHRPDLMRRFIDAKRPLISQVQTVTLTNANPFAIPTVGEFSGVGDHTEGTSHVAEGDMAISGATVTPRAVSGAYRVSRELVDSSNPVIDRIAMRKMVKDYRRFTEAKAYSAWTSGLASTLSVSTVAGLDAALDDFINDDEETADFVAVSPSYLTTLKADVDGSGRPHLARYSPVNATAELTGSRVGLVAVFGDTKAIRAANVAATKAMVARAEGLLWAESRTQQFSFSEVEGPGIVKLALWGYTAAARLEDTDVQLIDADATE